MADEAIDQIVDRWLNEPGFKEALFADPEGTAQRDGLELSADDWVSLRNAVAALGDEELSTRISKVLITGYN